MERRGSRACAVAGLALSMTMITGVVVAQDPARVRTDGWIEARTDHFTFFSNASRRRTARLARDLEELRAALERLTTLRLDTPVPTLVYAFANDRDFRPYKQLRDGQPADVSGYFRPTSHAAYIALDAGTGFDAGVVYHEYVHCFLSQNLPQLPLWLEEGLATFYESFELTRRMVRIGKPVDRHLVWLRHQRLMPLEVLFAVDHDSPIYTDGSANNGFYAQSWALVHLLLMGQPENQRALQRYVVLTGKGLSHEAAFAGASEISTEALEKELQGYVRRLVFRFLKVRVQLDVEFDLQVQEMTAAEVLYRLGDLLAHEEPVRACAEHYLGAAAELNHGPALAGLADLAERRARWQEAAELYQRAVAAAPDDARVLWRYGSFLLGRGGDLDAALMALRRATSVAPGFGPAWVGLTAALIEAGEMNDAAVAAAEKAYTMMSFRRDAAFDLLRVYVGTERWGEAATLIESAFGAGSDVRARALRILARGGIERAYELAASGQGDPALGLLDEIEGLVDGATGEAGLRQRLSRLRAAIAQRRLAGRIQEAEQALAAGCPGTATMILDEVMGQEPQSEVAEAARRLLRLLDGSAAEQPEPDLRRVAFPSRGEVDRLNALLAGQDLDGALTLLEDLSQRSGGDGAWIDHKIAEVRRARDHNRFVAAYNRVVDLYRSDRYREAVHLLEEVVAATPPGADQEAADALLEEVQLRLGR